MATGDSPRSANRPRNRQGESSRRNQHRKKRAQTRRPGSGSDETNGERSSKSLSSGALDQLNRENAKQKKHAERRQRGGHAAEYRNAEQTPLRNPRAHTKHKKKRVVSGAVMEEGRARGGRQRGEWREDSLDKEEFYLPQRRKAKPKKKLWILLGCSAVILLIIIIVAVVVSQKKKHKSNDSGSSNLDGVDPNVIPEKWKNTYLDPFSWATTTDFNATFTEETVGDLPVMGLFTDWDDSNKANDDVPALNQQWGSYEKKPARGVNLGGWLSLEPFITPSLFNYDAKMGVIDEWTLCKHLGSDAPKTLEKHYASFVTEKTFKDIRAAGLDHVRIPFSYWAVQVSDGDPYVFRTSWRYLLRGIEWARKYGIRVNLDVHGLPGSQNGWNHSGRWGTIGWLNGTDGQLNGKRSMDMHDKLSKFFAQDRYKNIISHYGLVNEPRMTFLQTNEVISWTENAYKLVRKNGIKALVIFGDGFMGLDNWQGLMQGYDDLVLDVHQYVIFNQGQIVYTHQEKVEYACDGWTKQAELSMDRGRGYGPTLFAEWSQADTDCATNLNGVGYGNRWEGTYKTGDKGSSVLTPMCPTKDNRCSCSYSNSDPGKFSSEYKKFLRMFAEAQMHSFEKGLGWWYWTWKTETAALWSYEAGLKAGILPDKANKRDFNCDSEVPDFAAKGLPEYQ